jgi:short-subunit dehydrogenase
MKDNVMITGTSRGLGTFLKDKFISEGHLVVSHNGKKHFDISNIDEVKLLAKMAIDNNVKILINNAAIGCPSIKFNEYNLEQISDMIDVNLKAPILLSHMLIDKLNAIININSMVGLEIKKPRTIYSATKWGLRGFSNSLKEESKSLNVLDVYPTNIMTTPDRKNAMDPFLVVEKIYESYSKKEKKLILDGRPK